MAKKKTVVEETPIVEENVIEATEVTVDVEALSESIESVDLRNKRIYTIGADEPYHIYDDSSWKNIISYVSNDLNVDL